VRKLVNSDRDCESFFYHSEAVYASVVDAAVNRQLLFVLFRYNMYSITSKSSTQYIGWLQALLVVDKPIIHDLGTDRKQMYRAGK
jgi:hypothetical protein